MNQTHKAIVILGMMTLGTIITIHDSSTFAGAFLIGVSTILAVWAVLRPYKP